jgi:hypothetical protein
MISVAIASLHDRILSKVLREISRMATVMYLKTRDISVLDIKKVQLQAIKKSKQSHHISRENLILKHKWHCSHHSSLSIETTLLSGTHSMTIPS